MTRNVSSQKRAVMLVAAKLRKRGIKPRPALKQAWSLYKKTRKALERNPKIRKEFEEIENPRKGGTMAKRKRKYIRRMKVFGLPLIPLAIIGGLIWWAVKKA